MPPSHNNPRFCIEIKLSRTSQCLTEPAQNLKTLTETVQNHCGTSEYLAEPLQNLTMPHRTSKTSCRTSCGTSHGTSCRTSTEPYKALWNHTRTIVEPQNPHRTIVELWQNHCGSSQCLMEPSQNLINNIGFTKKKGQIDDIDVLQTPINTVWSRAWP